MPIIGPRKCLTAAEAAVALGGRSNRATVIRLIKRGELKGKKLGREWRILPEWLDEFMSQPDNVTKA
jgi:excisionase family DNA binding protein